MMRAAPRLAFLAFSLLATTCSTPQAEHRHPGLVNTGATSVSGRGYIRVEDLPTAPQRVEDLPFAPAARRALKPAELTSGLIQVADRLLWKENPPLGTEVPVFVDGKDFVARLEVHFHPIGGALRPWGYHKGVTLYATE